MLAVKLLGQFDVRLDGIVIDIPSRTEQSLLAFLITNPGTSFRREQLAGMFWPDSTEANVKGYLRQATWRLRKTLKNYSPNSPDYILSNKINLAFNHQLPFCVDTQLLEKGQGQTPYELLEEISIYQGDLLPGFYEDWVILERERLRAIFDRKMHRLLQCLTSEQSWEDLIQQAERWISLGETPEPAYRALMIAYTSLGDNGKALAAFRRCVVALEHELGVLPTDETLQLEKRIRSGTPLFPVAEHKGVRGYELKQKLGSGGYGQVFTALQAATGRSVAVKVIFPQYANDPEFIRRFEIEPLVIPGAHQGSINKFSFNQDSSLLATAGLGGIAKVWRLKDTGAELLMNLSGHKNHVTDIGFSPNSSQVVTASADGKVRIWDISLAGTSEGLALETHNMKSTVLFLLQTGICWRPPVGMALPKCGIP